VVVWRAWKGAAQHGGRIRRLPGDRRAHQHRLWGSFGGIAALLGMLNSCAANVTVVNIDAGFKGGYVAGLIAKNVAQAETDDNDE